MEIKVGRWASCARSNCNYALARLSPPGVTIEEEQTGYGGYSVSVDICADCLERLAREAWEMEAEAQRAAREKYGEHAPRACAVPTATVDKEKVRELEAVVKEHERNHAIQADMIAELLRKAERHAAGQKIKRVPPRAGAFPYTEDEFVNLCERKGGK